MGKLLLLIAAIALVFWVRRLLRAPRGPGPGVRDPERMVNCAQCGLYLPVSEALEAQDRYYCSEQHRRLGAR